MSHGSRILKTAHKAAKALHRAGALDDLTMREMDTLCLPPSVTHHPYTHNWRPPHMAFTKRPQAPSFTTPRVTFKYPKLSEPDYKYQPNGEFSVKAVGPQADLQPLIDKLEVLHNAAVMQAQVEFDALPVKTRKTFEAKGVKGPVVNPFFNPIYDEDTEQPTGDVELNIKMAHSGEYKNGPKAGQKWTRTPAIFDAKGAKIVKAPAIWGGTVGKVSFEVGLNKDGEPGYFIPGTAACGLSLRLQAVQIIDLVQGGQKSADGYGFGEEDGYTSGGDAGGSESEADDSKAGDGDF